MMSVLVVMNGLMIEFVGCIDDVYYIGLDWNNYIDYIVATVNKPQARSISIVTNSTGHNENAFRIESCRPYSVNKAFQYWSG